MKALRLFVLLAGLLALWQLVVFATKAPPYILPGPLPVARGRSKIASERPKSWPLWARSSA